MTISEIKKNARESLANKWGISVLITFILILIIMGMAFAYFFMSYIPFINIVAHIGVLVLVTTIYFGLGFCFLELKRGNSVDCVDFLAFGFSNFKRIWCIIGNIFKKIWVYFLLDIIILIAALFTFGFSIGLSISLNSSIIAIFGTILTILFFIARMAISVLLTIKLLLYSLVDYIAWDNPEMSAKEVVEKSAFLMKGHRGELFLLDLSFLGWTLLSYLTLGIGLLWLIPYIETSFISFYENRLKEEDTKKVDILDDNSNVIE